MQQQRRAGGADSAEAAAGVVLSDLPVLPVRCPLLLCLVSLPAVSQEPVEHITAQPSDGNILEWHYLIHGPASSVYAGGLYHGKLVFPRDYPYRPPSILMLTPNGRFKTNTKLCLSMSDFHPESWNPLWSVQSILSGLLSFMLEATATYGSMEASDEERRRLAARSEQWNIDNDRQFNALFPQYKQRREERREQERRDRERQQQQQQHHDGQDREDTGGDAARLQQDEAKRKGDDGAGEESGSEDQRRAGQGQRQLSRRAATSALADAGSAGAAVAGAGSAAQGQGRNGAAAAAPALAAHPDASLDRLLIAVIVVSVAFGIVLLYT